MCEGTTTLHDLLDSDDTRVMLDALRTLGCGVRQSPHSQRYKCDYSCKGPNPKTGWWCEQSCANRSRPDFA